EATAVAMDTAGKAVLFSGITVLISLSAVMLVPSPAFRSMSLGIMLAVVFVLAATLTLLPAVLAKLGPRVNRLALPWVRAGEHRSPRFAAWARRLWRRPLRWGLAATVALGVLAVPVAGLDTGMPSITVVPAGEPSRDGYERLQAAFGPGMPGTLHVVVPAAEAGEAERVLAADPGIAAVSGLGRSGELALLGAVPRHDPSDERVGETIDRVRDALPAGAQ